MLIVGGGPFGLTLAIELGRRGIACTLVDGRPGTAVNPQANATQARTMELFRRLGISDEIRALGLPRDYPTDIAYFTRYAHRELARFRRPASGDASQIARQTGNAASAAELPHRVSQKFVEPVLRRHAEAVASVNFGWRLESFQEENDGVAAEIVHVASGGSHFVHADYLVGGDGARSHVRRALGIKLLGETGVSRDFFGGRMVAMHLRAPGFYDAVPHERAWMYWAFNPERRSWLAAVNGVDEFAFHTQLKPDEEDGEVTPELASALFRQVMGRDLEIEIISLDSWTAGHALVAERFREGRILIGGDAAHLFTPAAGLGYNTAVEDAVNLGWKLAAAVRGRDGPHLLDSYEQERRRLAQRNTGFARELAQSIGNFIPDPALEEEGEKGAALRRTAGEYLDAHARREFNIPGITFGGRYDGSPVIVADGKAPTEDSMSRYIPTASPGGRLPHFWLEDGRSVFDLLGFDWTVLDLTANMAGEALFRAVADELRMNLRILSLSAKLALEIFEEPLLLIRPDHIVAWRGDAHGASAHAILRQVLGHDPGSPPAPGDRQAACHAQSSAS